MSGKNLLKDNLGWFALGTNVVVAIIVPILIITNTSDKVPLLLSLILAFLSFIVLSCIELLIYNQKQHKERVWWKINEKSDLLLHNIRMDIHEINKEVHDKDDLFYFYIHKKIKELNDLATGAVTHHEIKIDEAMLDITKKMYDSAFKGTDDSVFMPVFLCEEEDKKFFFGSELPKEYFKWALSKVQNGSIKKIKRLFVYNNSSQLELESDSNMLRLIKFHIKHDNYECKKITSTTYNRLKNDSDLSELTKSFGIYGKKYLYTERVADINQIVGYYSKEETKITKYTNFFNQCWETAEDFSNITCLPNEIVDINYVFTNIER